MYNQKSILSLVTTLVAAFYLDTSLNYVVWLATSISPNVPLPLWATALLLLGTAGLAALSHKKPMVFIEYFCVGILIGLFFFIVSLFTSGARQIELLREFMLHDMQVLTFYGYVTAMLGLAAFSGYIAGLGFSWGQSLRKKITRK